MKHRIVYLFLLIMGLGTLSSLQAQELSWRKHRKLAQQAESEGDLYTAAENYRMAWEKKQSKEELIYAAAEIYYGMRDYRAAAEAYQHVPAGFNDDPLVTLKYARALKQDGQYDKARDAFETVLDSYTGPDKAILQDIVRVELQGIDLTRNMAANMDRSVEINRPGNTVNSESGEFASVAINEDVMYFTSTSGGEARIYETRRQGRNWSKADTPTGFPVVQGGQYANGSLSPDEQRFYFTICNNDGGWKGINTRCEIYVTKRSANGWTAPERLPDFINVQGVNATTPYVTHGNGQEVLYFASNREGGRGGLDLWYVTRDLGVDNMDYTFPVNLGPVVNSLGDELSPYFDVDDGTLYFASNGHPSIGGLDVFKANGGEVNWSSPVNLGLPINSGADDYGYVKRPSGFGGYFASNRAFGGDKTNTRHVDVFEFTRGGGQITLKASVYDQDSGNPLNNVQVALYQIFDNGDENLLVDKNFSNGSYLFELIPNRRFRVEVKAPGYQPGGYVFATDDPATLAYGQPLFLLPEEGVVVDPPIEDPTMVDTSVDNGNNTGDGGFMTDATTDPVVDTGGDVMSNGIPVSDSGENYTAVATSAKDNLEYQSSAPRYNGTYFRIQIIATKSFDPNNSRYSDLPTFGQVSTEYISSRNLTRVLVGDYFSEADVQSALNDVRATYGDAYVVKYTDGVRYGRYNF